MAEVENARLSFERKLLTMLDGGAPDMKIESDAFIAEHKFPEVETRAFLHGVLQSLAGGEYISTSDTAHHSVCLTEEGKDVLAHGSPEARVVNAVPADSGISKADLEAAVGDKAICKIGFGHAMKQKWIAMKSGLVVRGSTAFPGDSLQASLRGIEGTEPATVKDLPKLKKRKFVTIATRKSYTVSRGKRFSRERRAEAKDLTADMLKEGANNWQEQDFSPYSFVGKGREIKVGCLNPLLKVRREFRTILLEMGFREMPTNKFVESAFWNFDALFQPQQHPARDAHDTFFMRSPATTLTVPDGRDGNDNYVARVKDVHQDGGYGSVGYRYDWKLSESKKNILRTHTTAVSSRMLYKLANQPGGFKPVKYFSVDRVFRNETLDATHLAEFHQIEGLIADRGLTLGDLIGTIQEFFSRIGISDVRFKPAYNPYTEPSMEIFGFSKQLNKWMEVGNSGIFRPEMLRPMGLPEDVVVIAWGLGLERQTMLKYGLKNIRDLFGHKVKLSEVVKNPVCRYW